MEVELNHANFWLPSEFLNHKDMSILNDFGSYRINSDMCSPAESVMGSTETESDEEDYLNELTRKLANSALDDDSNFSNKLTLCGCKQVDGRLQVNGNRNQIGAQPPRRIPSLNSQFHQIQMKQHLMMKQQQQMMKQRQQQYEELARQSRVKNGGRMVAAPLSVWPTLQQSQQKPRGLGMRAVLLENPNTKRESTGTGVFLPRQIGAPIETHKKKGRSTVLLPEKVIQALNLNAEAQTRTNGVRLPHNHDAEMRYRNSGVMLTEQQRHVEKDLRLPQEWTY